MLERLILYSYNSAVFLSTSSNNYAVLSVDHTFLESQNTSSLDYVNVGGILRSGWMIADEYAPVGSIDDIANQLHDEANHNKLDKLTTEQCITKYVKTFQSDYSNVLLVSDSSLDANVVDNNTTQVVSYLDGIFHTSWNCGGTQAFAWTCCELHHILQT